MSSSAVVLIGLVEGEFFFGLWLAAGDYPRQARRAALIVFAIFWFYAGYLLFDGRQTCGCFGKLFVSPWQVLLVDSVIFFSLWQSRAGESAQLSSPAMLVPLPYLLMVFVLIGVPAAFAMARSAPATLAADGEIVGDGRVVLLEPRSWVGKRLPLLARVDIGGQLARGQWIVMLHRDGCPECAKMLARLRERGPDRIDLREAPVMALVELPPFGQTAEDDFPWGIIGVRGRLDDSREWFVKTPLIVGLSEGVVLSVAESLDGEPFAQAFPLIN